MFVWARPSNPIPVGFEQCWRSMCQEYVLADDDLGLCPTCREELRDPAFTRPPRDAEVESRLRA